ncbi:thioesterase II family protein [Plantactinospora sp. KBS50]|uniref:thioesterase II family protein n=1 Tax=Plantactinospora sp. KBS50 TaxID=2024580 RepID=UPI000BAAEC0B|nr:thioesterase domain-containing protein [Plantactinospora sp. KBS50]ASW54307.1 thioesterase [Plantactinospora sp. KBS50]
MSAGDASSHRRWFVPPPAPEHRLLFLFPYAGVGASSYRPWPRMVDDVQVCALQPPGRENRTREEPHRSHAAFAADLADALTPYLDRPYYFAGHCGAVPFALDTIDELNRRGLRLPERLIASSWGAPQRGLYGRLNFVDLETVDLVAEVSALFARAGAAMRPDMAELLARVLRTDLEVQRGYRFDPDRRIPLPVTVVAWTDDAVVPPDLVTPGWSECAEQVTHELLIGEHLDFLRCPDVLREALRRWLSAAPASADDPDDLHIRVGGD